MTPLRTRPAMKTASQKRMRRRWSVCGMYLDKAASYSSGGPLGHGTASCVTARNVLLMFSDERIGKVSGTGSVLFLRVRVTRESTPSSRGVTRVSCRARGCTARIRAPNENDNLGKAHGGIAHRFDNDLVPVLQEISTCSVKNDSRLTQA